MPNLVQLTREKNMAIDTVEDIIAALDAEPALLEAVRARLLTRELLELPEKFALYQEATDRRLDRLETTLRDFMEAANRRFDRLETTLRDFMEVTNRRLEALETTLRDFMEVTNRRLEALETTLRDFMESTNRRFEALEASQNELRDSHYELKDSHDALVVSHNRLAEVVQSMHTDLGRVKGYHARLAAIDEMVFVARQMGYRLERVLSRNDILDIEEGAGDAAKSVSSNDLESFLRADAILDVSDRNGGPSLYIAAEISYTVRDNDTSRAIRNAEMLAMFTDRQALAAVAGVQLSESAAGDVDSKRVFFYRIPLRVLEPD